MTGYLKFYQEYNNEVQCKYKDSLDRINKIKNECLELEKSEDKKQYGLLFNKLSQFMLKLAEIENSLNQNYIEKNTFEKLFTDNHELYSEIIPENYKTSYCNPQYTVSLFGESVGQLMAFFYMEYRNCIEYAFRHKYYRIYEYNELFIQMYEYIRDNKIEYEELKNITYKFKIKNIVRDKKIFFMEDMNTEYTFLSDISEKSDLKDLRYLFKYGKYVSENEIKIAKLLQNYSDIKLRALGKTIVRAFLRGFETHNKNRKARDTVRIVHVIGQERITRLIIEELKKNNLKYTIVSTFSTEANRQFHIDHQFDSSIYVNCEFLKLVENSYSKAVEECKNILEKIAGNLIMLQFGEKSCKLESKSECLKFSLEQMNMMKNHNISMRKIMDMYIPRNETSYTGIAFPNPEIGKKFDEIYEAIMDVNMMDGIEYERIQQVIIDALDKGKYVHVKGRGDNLTDIKVNLHEIENEEKETNFSNCGADVNIPVGEVYTSPVLNKTDGLLHVKEILIRDIKYSDLMLKFQNGYIAQYACKNFDSECENKKLIEQNLLLSNKTLPMGEFAIGTNTLAYMVARKYGIIDDLHTLIVEKMGPHFAVGDTCFAWAEDIPVYNILNNKEVIARENEKTCQRKVNINDAYTNTHSDITLPYDSLDFVSIITKDEETIDVIKDGRFVLEGTEKLNDPFDKM